MTTVLAMLNQKGGVGKTTLTVNLGGLWARQGRQVLLVDNDPQSSLTQGLLGPDATASLDPAQTVAGLYAGTALSAAQAVHKTAFPGLHLLAGSKHANRYNNGAPQEQPWQWQECLREAVEEVRGSYDLVLIDCPPNLNLCTWASLTASDAVLVPVQAEDYGAQGLPDVLQSVEAVRALTNPKLDLLGIVLSMYQPRRAVNQIFAEQLRETYGERVFQTVVTEAAEVAEATMLRKPVVCHKPKGAAAKAISALAAEIEGRILRTDVHKEVA